MSGGTKELNTKGGANRFKYQSFTERVSTIKINATRRVYKFNNEIPEDAETFFQESLMQWREQNCTREFTLFVGEVNQYTKSLPMILFHKKTIAEILVKHIKIKDTLAFEPLLSLTTMFAKDLQEEMYEFFPMFYEAITSLLTRSDPKIYECVFNALAYLFKYLSKQLISEIDKTFIMMKSLFGNNKEYIRRFACESFSFLLRKVKGDKLKNTISNIIKSIDENMENINSYYMGIALLLSETLKQVNNQLYSRSNEYFNSILNTLEQITKSTDIFDEPILEAIKEFINDICHHVNAANSKIMWDALLNRLIEYSNSCSTKSKEELSRHFINISKLMIIIKVALKTRKGYAINDRKEVFKAIEKIMNTIFDPLYVEFENNSL